MHLEVIEHLFKVLLSKYTRRMILPKFYPANILCYVVDN